MVYKAQVTSGAEIKSYIGISGGPLKQRFNNHTKSFKHEKYEKETELSKYVWDLKRRGISFGIEWEIVNKSNTSQRKSGQCNLCMEEKLAILHTKDTLNKKQNSSQSVVMETDHPAVLRRNKDPSQSEYYQLSDDRRNGVKLGVTTCCK